MESIYAGFWIRFGANLIDSIVLLIPLWVLNTIILLVTGVSTFDYTTGVVDENAFLGGYILALLVNILIGVLYFVVLESSNNQGTVGKMAVGVKVVDVNGERITFARSLGRYFSKMLSGIMYIGYIMIGLTKEKRGLHDFIAGTYVVKKNTVNETRQDEVNQFVSE